MTNAAPCPPRAVESCLSAQRLRDEQVGTAHSSKVNSGASQLASLAELMGKRAAAAAIQAGRKPASTDGMAGTGIKQVHGVPSFHQKECKT